MGTPSGRFIRPQPLARTSHLGCAFSDSYPYNDGWGGVRETGAGIASFFNYFSPRWPDGNFTPRLSLVFQSVLQAFDVTRKPISSALNVTVLKLMETPS